jgi:transcriptional regulator with XRE-family HTH domain
MKKPANIEMGERLKTVRGELSLRKMAERLNISVSAYVRCENGDGLPSVKFLKSLHDNLGINTEWLLYGRGPMYQEDIDKPDIEGVVDENALETVIEAVRSLRGKKRVSLPSNKEAVLISMLYDDLINGKIEKGDSLKKRAVRYYKAIR